MLVKKMQLSTVSLPKKELQYDPTNQYGSKSTLYWAEKLGGPTAPFCAPTTIPVDSQVQKTGVLTLKLK